MFDSDETLIIGVDGGGSGCRVAIGTRAKGVIAEAKGGSANVTTDLEGALVNINCALARALAATDLPTNTLPNAVAFLGLAGVMPEEMGQEVKERFQFKHATVTSDRPTTVMGALDGNDGMVAAIGTGAFFASSKKGKERFVGGWGNRLADQASGSWLGCQALTKVLLCYDGIETHTDLTRQVLSHFDDDPIELSKFSLHASPSEYASFCPIVIEAEKAQDRIACELLDFGAGFILRALHALEFQPHDEIVLSGGVGQFYKERLSEKLPNKLSLPRNPAVIGAFKLAMQADSGLKKDMP